MSKFNVVALLVAAALFYVHFTSKAPVPGASSPAASKQQSAAGKTQSAAGQQRCEVPRKEFSGDEQEAARKALEAKGAPMTSESFADAIEAGDSATVNEMIAAGIDLDGIDPGTDHSPLNTALYKNRALVPLLVESGADVNKKAGTTVPFLLALSFDDIELIKLMMKHCADVNLAVPLGIQGAPELVSTALDVAIRKDIAYVKLLVEAGADVNRHSFGASPLRSAVFGGHYEIAKYLIDHGAVDKFPPGGTGPGLLQLAYRHNNTELVNLLRDQGYTE